MEISCLRQAANAQLSLASSRASFRRSSVSESVRGLPRLSAVKLGAPAAVAGLDFTTSGDGGVPRFRFGGGRIPRIGEAPAAERRARSAGVRAGSEVGGTVDASVGHGVLHTVHCFACSVGFFRYALKNWFSLEVCVNCAP